MFQRRRFQQLNSLIERPDQKAAHLRCEANASPHGPEQEKLLCKARHAETAIHVDEWFSSSGLRAPQ
jgi:hypothetical protein